MHTGLFETCSRNAADSAYATCRDDAIAKSPPLLKDVLATPQGQTFFSLERVEGDYKEWVPPQCAQGNCTVQILHIDPEYDKGLIENIVLKLGLAATVVYVGEEHLDRLIWESYTKRTGALVYNYSPNTQHHGISTLSLPRSHIDPRLDLKRQQLHKLAWPGLAEHRGGDALAFVKAFDLDETAYAELAELYDHFDDAQAAACAWVERNTPKWRGLVRFPERQHEPLLCLNPFRLDSSKLCDKTYFLGWVAVLAQLVCGLFMWVLSHFANRYWLGLN